MIDPTLFLNSLIPWDDLIKINDYAKIYNR